MTPDQARRPDLTEDARRILDDLLIRQRDEILASASRGLRGPVDAVDVIRAYNSSRVQSTDGSATEVESRILQSERRLSTQFTYGLSVVIAPVFVTALVVMLSVVLPYLNIRDDWLPYLAALLAAVLLATAGLWILLLAQQRARNRHLEYSLDFAVLRAATREQSSRDLATLRSEDPLTDRESLEAEEAAIGRYSFMNQWITIEKQIYQLGELTLGGASSRRSISAVVQSLVHDGIISEDAEFRIKRVLITRNEVVHREQSRLDWPRLEYDMKQIEVELNDALRGARARRRHTTGT